MHDILTYQQEFYRKVFHISSSSIIPLLLWYLGREVFLPLLLASSIMFLFLDYSRRNSIFIDSIATRFFKNITRPDELRKITGASWVLIGASITIVLFNEKIAIIALLIMSLSDSAAAIIGIKYGKTILYKKSLEGSLGFFIITYIILMLSTSIPLILLLFISFFSTMVELLAVKICNDNFIIPISTGLLLSVGGVS